MLNPMRQTDLERTGGDHPSGPPALALQAGAARRRRRARPAASPCCCSSAYGAASRWRFSARLDRRASASCSAVALTALVGWFLVRPLMRQRDRRAGRALSRGARAVAPGRDHQRDRGEQASRRVAVAAFAGAGARLVETAVEKCRGDRRRTRASSAAPVRRYSGAHRRRLPSPRRALFCSGPAYLRHALSALLMISRSVEAAAPYRIEVTPGNATVPRGADQTITAKLDGFEADQAALMVRKAPTRRSSACRCVRSERRRRTVRGHAVRPRRRRSTTSSRRRACGRRSTR